jgi:hypothetical protein
MLVVVQAGETRHWRKQSSQFQQLYRGEQAAFDETVANYRAAAATARAADLAAAQRTEAEQRSISQRSQNALESRIADARARADQLRGQSRPAIDPGVRPATAVPGLPAAARGADQTAGQNRLPDADALTATEQAIQLDELIKWVREQAKVEVNAENPH